MGNEGQIESPDAGRPLFFHADGSWVFSGADQRPGKDAYDRYEELKNRFSTIITPYTKLGPKM